MLAHVVEQQHEPRPLRHRPDLGADDARRRQPALEDRRLEVVVEEVGGAAGEQPHEVVQHARLDAAHVPRQIGQLGQSLGRRVEQVGRRLVEQRLDGADHHRDVVAVLVVGVGVALGVARDLLDVLVAVLPHHEAVAVLHRAERGRHQQRHEAVLDEVELVDDLGPQQAERVRERRELEARTELLGDRRPTHQVAPLEDQRAQPGLGEIGAVDEPVVPATDDDRVVLATTSRCQTPRVRSSVASSQLSFAHDVSDTCVCASCVRARTSGCVPHGRRPGRSGG